MSSSSQILFYFHTILKYNNTHPVSLTCLHNTSYWLEIREELTKIAKTLENKKKKLNSIIAKSLTANASNNQDLLRAAVSHGPLRYLHQHGEQRLLQARPEPRRQTTRNKTTWTIQLMSVWLKISWIKSVGMVISEMEDSDWPGCQYLQREAQVLCCALTRGQHDLRDVLEQAEKYYLTEVAAEWDDIIYCRLSLGIPEMLDSAQCRNALSFFLTWIHHSRHMFIYFNVCQNGNYIVF